MQIPKSNQLAYRGKKKTTPRGVTKEAHLQAFTNEYLHTLGLKYIRVPDEMFAYVKLNTKPTFQRWFCGTFSGIPDNIVLIPRNVGCPLALCIELKSADGKLHENQKTNARDYNWVVCRTPEEVMVAVANAKSDMQRRC